MADFEDYWVKFDLLLLKELEVHENTLEVAKAIDKEWWNYVDIKIYPDVLPILHTLRDKSIKLGVISNSLKRELELMLDMIDLKGFFDLEVGIDTFRQAKPDKEIFLQSVEKLKVSPHEALFVGDSTEIDYEGAKNAGLKALLLDREHRISSRNVETIHTFNELLEHL
jgi:HAD superfamily hydrolase (TIGR01549 family)